DAGELLCGRFAATGANAYAQQPAFYFRTFGRKPETRSRNELVESAGSGVTPVAGGRRPGVLKWFYLGQRGWTNWASNSGYRVALGVDSDAPAFCVPWRHLLDRGG